MTRSPDGVADTASTVTEFQNLSSAQKAAAARADHPCLRCGDPARFLLCDACVEDAGRAGERTRADVAGRS